MPLASCASASQKELGKWQESGAKIPSSFTRKAVKYSRPHFNKGDSDEQETDRPGCCWRMRGACSHGADREPGDAVRARVRDVRIGGSERWPCHRHTGAASRARLGPV